MALLFEENYLNMKMHYIINAKKSRKKFMISLSLKNQSNAKQDEIAEWKIDN